MSGDGRDRQRGLLSVIPDIFFICCAKIRKMVFIYILKKMKIIKNLGLILPEIQNKQKNNDKIKMF